MKTSKRNKLKIVSAVSVTIFSLFALTMGIFAWFASVLTSSKTADVFEVTTTGDCTIADVKLYKFTYPESAIHEGYDYLRPQDGAVNKYDFNQEEEHFGYLDAQNNWVNVSSMNTYDPVELIISQDKSLKDLNCNAIYEISFNSSSFEECLLVLNSLLRNDVTPGENEILLSDCVDFDVFFPSDLSDTNPLFLNSETGEYDKYYPSYKDNLSAIEKDYYKISYLSSLVAENGHANFYSTNPKPTTLEIYSNNITLVNSEFKVYINANYAPKRLEQYSKTLYLHNILALYDFGFEISLSEANS